MTSLPGSLNVNRGCLARDICGRLKVCHDPSHRCMNEHFSPDACACDERGSGKLLPFLLASYWLEICRRESAHVECKMVDRDCSEVTTACVPYFPLLESGVLFSGLLCAGKIRCAFRRFPLGRLVWGCSSVGNVDASFSPAKSQILK